jgi:tetraacyldisaccharide 4''-kinase
MLNRTNILLRILLLIPAGIFGLITGVRNWLYDQGIIASTEFDIPVICVGNITVGGTGKTPHVEYLLKILLSEKVRVSAISRGYRRKTRGFLVVEPVHTAIDVGDEPCQIARKFPLVPFAVCSDRVHSIKTLRKLFSETEVVVMDDGFQHRAVQPGLSIVLMDYNRPIYDDQILPLGNLRENSRQIHRANVVVVTKCPSDVKPIDLRIISKRLNLFPYQTLYFTRFTYGVFKNVWTNIQIEIILQGTTPILAVAGIAQPKMFFLYLDNMFQSVEKQTYTDHHQFGETEIWAMARFLELHQDGYVITTEKDAVRLSGFTTVPEIIRERFLFVPIEVEFLNNGEKSFNKQIVEYVRKDKRNGILYQGPRKN